MPRNDDSGESSPSESGPAHTNVRCDGCRRVHFRGTRRKCLVCADFDLCGTCFDKPPPHPHPMRIVPPGPPSRTQQQAPVPDQMIDEDRAWTSGDDESDSEDTAENAGEQVHAAPLPRPDAALAPRLAQFATRRAAVLFAWNESNILRMLPPDVVLHIIRLAILPLEVGCFHSRITFGARASHGPDFRLRFACDRAKYGGNAPEMTLSCKPISGLEGMSASSTTATSPPAFSLPRLIPVCEAVWLSPFVVSWGTKENSASSLLGGKPNTARIEFSLDGSVFRGWCAYPKAGPFGFFGWRRGVAAPLTGVNRQQIEEALEHHFHDRF